MADIQLPKTGAPAVTHSMNREESPTTLVSNIVAIAGFIILIVVVIWGLIHLASLSRDWLASIFGQDTASAITVDAPNQVTSGEPFNVSWKFTAPTGGTFAFLYQCESKTQFQTSGAAGTVNIPCGAAFTTGENKSIALTPILRDGVASSSVPLTIIFMPSATSTTATSGEAVAQVQGSKSVSVVAASTPAPTMPAPTITTVVTPAVGTPPTQTIPVQSAHPAGPADLSVQITSANVDGSGQATVVFKISNDGGSASGSYYFTASLLTAGGYVYTSPLQDSLAPGAYVVNTLRFSQVAGGTVTIHADSTNSVSEMRENNNVTSQTMSAPYGYNSSTYYNQYYNQTYPYYQANQYPSTYSYTQYGTPQQPQVNYSTYPYNYNYLYPYNYVYQNDQYPYAQYYPYVY